jgi:flagellar motility protein MotE (MotC chaperone)
MKVSLPRPRLLPATIGVLAVLLSVKTTGLVRLAITASATAGESGPAAKPDAAAPAAPTPATPAPAAATGEKPAAAAGEKPAAAATPAAPPGPGAVPLPGPPDVSDSERAILLELRKRREDLDIRERAFAGREAVIAAAEHRLSQRVAELQALQAKLESLETARVQREEANWRGLVKVYESMKPRDAAAIFNDLDMQILLPVLDRMKETKAAPVLAAMQPDKARQATTGLAQLRLKQTTPPNGS